MVRVVPRALLEAAEDRSHQAGLQQRERRLGAERVHTAALPAEPVKRQLDGGSPVRVWREHRHLVLGELADRPGIMPSSISAIEASGKPGSTAKLGKARPGAGRGSRRSGALTSSNGQARARARDGARARVGKTEMPGRLAGAQVQVDHWRCVAEEARIALARVEGEAAAMRLVIDELRAELTWHRRTWWQKLFG